MTEALDKQKRELTAKLEAKALQVIERQFTLNEKVTFSGIASKAKISRNFLYTNPRVAERIYALRDQSKSQHKDKVKQLAPFAKRPEVQIKRLTAKYSALYEESRRQSNLIKELKQQLAYYEDEA